MEFLKYPRTPHLPFSRFATSDDLVDGEWPFLTAGGEMVVTEKMDGENTTLYRSHLHARSLDSQDHPSRSFVKGLWGAVRWSIPEGRRIVCENVYAEHSLRYENLPTFVFALAVVDNLNAQGKLVASGGIPTFLSWDASQEVFQELGLISPSELYRGPASLSRVEDIFRKQDHSRQEGVVVRDTGAFPQEAFASSVGKAVRRGHITTTSEWTRTWRPNSLRSAP